MRAQITASKRGLIDRDQIAFSAFFDAPFLLCI